MEDPSKGVPQFATAEFAPGNPSMACAACRKAIAGPYYQCNAAKVCPECAKKIQDQMPKDSHAAFVRSILFWHRRRARRVRSLRRLRVDHRARDRLGVARRGLHRRARR